MASIYDDPEIYDLEHSGPQQDIGFFQEFMGRHRPARILEYACGNGRLTFPLAAAAACWGGKIVGLDSSQPMLDDAGRHPNPHGIDWQTGDMTRWRPAASADLVIAACGSLSHLLSPDDQIATWKNARASVATGGRFVVAELAPDYPTMAESMRLPARVAMRFDGDLGTDDDRLLRYRTASYRADLQRLRVRYLYDRFRAAGEPDRLVEDYDAHVYFPNELRLLFTLAGFRLERTWGGYDGAPFSHASPAMIFCGVAE